MTTKFQGQAEEDFAKQHKKIQKTGLQQDKLAKLEIPRNLDKSFTTRIEVDSQCKS